MAQRQGAPGTQPAATARHQHRVQALTTGRSLVKHFQPRRALAGNDIRVVERRHHRQPVFRRQPGTNFLTILVHPVIRHHARAIFAGTLDFGARRICGHDNGGGDAQNLPGCRNPLCVIA